MLKLWKKSTNREREMDSHGQDHKDEEDDNTPEPSVSCDNVDEIQGVGLLSTDNE